MPHRVIVHQVRRYKKEIQLVRSFQGPMFPFLANGMAVPEEPITSLMSLDLDPILTRASYLAHLPHMD